MIDKILWWCPTPWEHNIYKCVVPYILDGGMMNKLTPTEIAYIAGIIDGEGSIGLTCHRERRCPRGFNYEPYVMISNTSEELMKRIKEITGIGYYWSKRFQNINKKWKIPFAWQIGKRREIIDLLQQIIPYLIIKKERATLLLEYLQVRETQEKERIAFQKECQIKYTQKQDDIYNRLKLLNHRGVGG